MISLAISKYSFIRKYSCYLIIKPSPNQPLLATDIRARVAPLAATTKRKEIAMDQETMRTVVKWAGPVVGFLVWQANGMSGKGFILGLLAGFLATGIAVFFVSVLATP
jgi:hypothetical protein